MVLRPGTLAFFCAALVACGAQPGCTCAGYQSLEPYTFAGERLDTAASVRLSPHGFTTLNQRGLELISSFAPDGSVAFDIPCSIETVQISFLSTKLAIADTGDGGCNGESCGRMDGVCSGDRGHPLSLELHSLQLTPKGPDVVEAAVSATVRTGQLPISSEGSGSSLLCLGSGRAKFTVDLNTTRAPPNETTLELNLKLAIDTRWQRLVHFEVAEIGNASACSGSITPPNCIDPNDMEILNEGCGTLNLAQLGAVKSLLINQLASSLKKEIGKALDEGTCVSCDGTTRCPSSGASTSSCDLDAGLCRDTVTQACVPSLLGTEGRLDVGSLLGSVGVAAGTSMDVSVGAGGSVVSAPAGLTLGFLGGAKETRVATCVRPLTWAPPPALPLPDFDFGAPADYDLGIALSNQFLDEALFRAHQAGALCLSLGAEQVAQLESNLVATLLPSLGLHTEGQSVPMRVVLRPSEPPTATVGQGRVDANGMLVTPLVTLAWPRLEIDLYAQIADRDTRLLTLTADLQIPLALETDPCDGLRPVIGTLTNAITNVQVTHIELLAESGDALVNLVPSLLSLLEPQLAGALSSFTLPELNGFTLSATSARGIGPVPGTGTYQHAAIYASLADAGACSQSVKRLEHRTVEGPGSGQLQLSVDHDGVYRARVDDGLWSFKIRATNGQLPLEHPRLKLAGPHHVELRRVN